MHLLFPLKPLLKGNNLDLTKGPMSRLLQNKLKLRKIYLRIKLNNNCYNLFISIRPKYN